eukprot:TRINITY_DN3010_c0_g1_i1.p1 TRINITY_DN3010_c0_g1~~TRINITY_DN3010_c0_g1_i1.p1  ORF type:complete len:390 (-),score=75.17 TRINITY_DN3010_c0_g1_i1:2331-3500(-)
MSGPDSCLGVDSYQSRLLSNLDSEPGSQASFGSVANDRLFVSYCAVQGKRPTMEDAHQVILQLQPLADTAFVAVYDGHGGRDVADFVSQHLHDELSRHPAVQTDIEAALRHAFLVMDDLLRKETVLKADLMGTTAAVCLINDEQIVAAGAGDTRVVLARSREAICLTTDHKPNLGREKARIEAAGGIVIFGRTNGTLAVSRAIGDFAMKSVERDPDDQCVTANPEITRRAAASEEDDFVLLACDGVWDVMTNQDVVNFVYERLDLQDTPEEIVKRLAERCVVSRDNITVILVVLKKRFPYLTTVTTSPDHKKPTITAVSTSASASASSLSTSAGGGSGSNSPSAPAGGPADVAAAGPAATPPRDGAAATEAQPHGSGWSPSQSTGGGTS